VALRSGFQIWVFMIAYGSVGVFVGFSCALHNRSLLKVEIMATIIAISSTELTDQNYDKRQRSTLLLKLENEKLANRLMKNRYANKIYQFLKLNTLNYGNHYIFTFSNAAVRLIQLLYAQKKNCRRFSQ
jgi:hypothetical protein